LKPDIDRLWAEKLEDGSWTDRMALFRAALIRFITSMPHHEGNDLRAPCEKLLSIRGVAWRV
jgi:hypothetical protein